MNERLETIKMTLSDAGCGQDAVDRAGCLLEAGCTEELIRHLRLCRCGLMEELHMTQKRVDRIDRLIRQTEKTLAKKIEREEI